MTINRVLFFLKALIVSAAGCLILNPCYAQITISEFHYDNVSTDTGEAIELEGPAGDSLSNWQIVLYNGNGGAAYKTIALDGALTAVEGCDNGFQVIDLPTNGLQNGAPDGIALVDNSGVVTEFISYEGVLTAVDGPAAGLSSIDVGVSETSNTPEGFSLQKINGIWVGPQESTFGGCASAGNTEDPVAMRISDIQGAGAVVTTTNPVIVRAVVTASYLDSDKLNGFFVQEELMDSDGDPTTSEGIFVYCPDCTEIQVGDLVEVIGSPTDFFDMSQISAESVTVQASNIPLPPVTAITLPVSVDPSDVQAALQAVADFYEQYEGMLIRIDSELTVTETFNLGRYGELLLSADGRLRQFTDANLPSDVGFTQHTLNRATRVITLDDARTQQNPDPVPYPVSGLSANNVIRSGYTKQGLTGVLNYSFSTWRIQPVLSHFDYDFVADNPRPTSPEIAPAGIRVASFNVLNNFTTIDNGQAICGPNQNLGCRGADNAAEFARQQDKLVDAICALDADIVGLMELENSATGQASALTNLVTAINGQCDGYEAIETGPVGSDAITVGLIYRPGLVALSGDVAVLDTPEFLNPNASAVDKNRPAVGQAFKDVATGNVFTVVMNHLKSKGSNCSDSSDPNDDDTTSGQGNCNGTRTRAAEAELNWLFSGAAGLPTDYILLMGDLNAYRNEDPIKAITNAGFVDLLDMFGQQNAYGYVFNGEWGYLDHALANDAFVPFVVDATEWHINADESTVFDYNQEFKPSNYENALFTVSPYRSSDHDPIVLTIEFPVPQEPSLKPILDQFYESVQQGSIKGYGRFELIQLINLWLYERVINIAVALESEEKSQRPLCHWVGKAIYLSDGVGRPKDLITGEGATSLNRNLVSYQKEKCSTR